MKLLFVTPFYTYPLNAGGKVALYNLLKHIGRYHDITLLSVFDRNADIYTSTLNNYCKKVIVVEKGVSNPRADFFKAILPFS